MALVLIGTVVFTIPIYGTGPYIIEPYFTIFEVIRLCNEGPLMIIFSDSEFAEFCKNSINLVRISYFLIIFGFALMVIVSKKIKDTSS